MNHQKKRLLVVEDESEIRQLILLHLRREGFEVDEVASGERVQDMLQANTYNLVILDWMLPGASGLEITRWMRSHEKTLRTPILFVTAKVEPEHIAAGLDAGADDYLTKPFDTLVLMARVNALLRRQEWLALTSEKSSEAKSSKLKVAEVVLDLESIEAFVGAQKIDLTRSEFRLLECLMENQGKVLSRERLIEQIQGEGVNVVGRTVDTHIFGLRKKLGVWSDLIETIRGVGYRVKYNPES